MDTGKERDAHVKLRQLIVKCLQVTRLNRLAHRLYYGHVHGFDAATRSTLEGIEKAFAHAKELGTLGEGDYYEFGLFKGYSFWTAQKTAKQHEAQSMRFFGFDSFAGLPDVGGLDKTARDDFYQRRHAPLQFRKSLPSFKGEPYLLIVPPPICALCSLACVQ